MGLIQNKVTVSQPTAHIVVKDAGGLRGLTGPQGEKGEQGNPGTAATVNVGSTTTLPAGSNATVQNVGSIYAATLNFGIPKGDKGDTGDTGAAATISVGSTSTLPAGSGATVTNSGTSSAAVFNFGIPKGEKGAQGDQGVPGADGFSPTATVSKTGDTATITITDKDGTTTAQISDGVTPTIDDALSPTSENPVQNKVVTNALAGKQPSFEIVEELPATGVEGSEYLVDATYETATELTGDTKQTTIPGSQLLTKNGMATPETDTAFWAALTTTKITKTNKSDGWANIEQIATGFGNFNVKRAGVANFEVSTVYTLIVELKNVSGSGAIGLIQTTQTNDPYASYTVVQGASASSGGNAQINIANPDLVSVLKVTTKSSFANATQGFRGFTRDNVSVGSKFDIRVSILAGDHSTDWQSYIGENWKPFVGGVDSPNPDYPQEVQTVSGEQTITVSNGQGESQEYEVNLGKNLFDVSSISENTGASTNGTENHEVTYSTNNSRAVTLIKVEPNTTYKLSIGDTSYSSRIFFVGMKNTTLESGHSFSWCVSGATLTTNSKDAYLLGVIEATQGGTISAITNAKIQLEKGSTATTYAPYFTPIELCKIGDYQDYIYKSGEDWYIHKAIRRYDFTGSETVRVSDDNRANFQNIFNDDKFVGAGGGYCDHAKYNPIQTQVSASLLLGEFALQNYQDANYNFIMRLPNDSYTVAQIQQWFIDNPTTVYYPLETPTDTQITNSALIAQLEALNAGQIKSTDTITIKSNCLPTSLILAQGANSHLEPYVYYNGKFEKVQIV